MGIAIRWQELKWRASVRAAVTLLKYHTAVVLSVVLFRLCVMCASQAVRFNVDAEAGYGGLYRPCAAAMSSYAGLLVMLMVRHAAFRASTKTDTYYELLGLLNVCTTVLCVAVISNVMSRVCITSFNLFVIFCVAQRLDLLRALDRESIAAPHFRTFLSLGAFHVAVSLAVSVVLCLGFWICSLLWGLVGLPPMNDWQWARIVDGVLQLVPGVGGYGGGMYGVEGVFILAAAAWTIAMTDAFYEQLNREISHMDQQIANNLEEFPSHGSERYEDELVAARALLNYSRGVCMTLDPVQNKFEANGNAMHVSFPEDPRRCSMVPFAKMPQGAMYGADGKRQRYQVDSVVYRMLIEPSGRLFSSYVEAFMECLVTAEAHIVALTNNRESTGDLLIDLNRDSGSRSSCSGWLNFTIDSLLGRTPKVPYKTSDTMLLSVIYMRGLANWLCIANMLGYGDAQVQQVAKEYVAQCVSLSKVVATVRRYSMPLPFSNTLDVITNVINVALKQMSVYADVMLYSTFETDFDTFRLLEKMYKPGSQPKTA